MKQQFGICEWSLPVSGPLAIRIAAEAGYEGMQLGEAGGRRMGYPLNHRRVQELYREAAAECGLALHSLNLGALLAEGTMNYAAGTEQGDYARESLEKGFAACGALGIRRVVITVDPVTEEAFENVITHLNFARGLAGGAGVEISIESARPLSLIQRLLDELGGDVKICMDLLNPLRFGTGNPREQIRAFGKDRISHFHMKDSVRPLFQPGQRGCVPLGQGDAGYRESVEIIKELSYEGWMITENYYYLPPLNDGNSDFMELAAKDLKTLRESFDALIPSGYGKL